MKSYLDKTWFSKLGYFLVAILWGTSFAFQKTLVSVMNPVNFTFWNFFLSALVFVFVAIYNRQNFLYRWREGLLLGVFLSGLEISQMIGLSLTSSANTVFLTNLGMLILPFLGFIIFKHKVKSHNTIALLLAIFGMYFLVGGVDHFGVGDVLQLVSAIFMGLYFLYIEKFYGEKSSHITVLIAQQFIVVSLACVLYQISLGVSFFVPDFLWTEILWQILIFTTIPYLIVALASVHTDEMIAAIYDGVVEPLVGAVVSWGLFHEQAGVLNILGGFTMLFAFWLSIIASYKHFVFGRHR